VSLTFQVIGLPAPQGSKTMLKHNKSGKMVMLESSKAVKPWRAQVKEAAELALPLDWMMITRAVVLWVVFSLPRPKNHYRSGKFAHLLRDDAPPYPVTGGNDTDKLERAVMDAITDAKVWADDSLVVSLLGEKVYAGDDRPHALSAPGAWITIKVRDGE
jgi:Holliday junction resolvase RusA-like endonuclease